MYWAFNIVVLINISTCSRMIILRAANHSFEDPLIKQFMLMTLNNAITYREKFVETCHKIFELGLAKHEERQQEVAMFTDCIEEAKQENKSLATAKIDEFIAYKNKVRNWLNAQK